MQAEEVDIKYQVATEQKIATNPYQIPSPYIPTLTPDPITTITKITNNTEKTQVEAKAKSKKTPSNPATQ